MKNMNMNWNELAIQSIEYGDQVGFTIAAHAAGEEKSDLVHKIATVIYGDLTLFKTADAIEKEIKCRAELTFDSNLGDFISEVLNSGHVKKAMKRIATGEIEYEIVDDLINHIQEVDAQKVQMVTWYFEQLTAQFEDTRFNAREVIGGALGDEGSLWETVYNDCPIEGAPEVKKLASLLTAFAVMEMLYNAGIYGGFTYDNPYVSREAIEGVMVEFKLLFGFQMNREIKKLIEMEDNEN